MRLMVIVKASKASQAGEMASYQLLTEMGGHDFGDAMMPEMRAQEERMIS